ncbi:hypothetical protein HHI36_020357 [Cryptolaemus montrouzieri]|uniref:Ionotropic receptor n=1 Tax=Cryptolaemus montrouzieri TaxID=559131 RepID=A0ABD2NAH5_9CUCU
MLVAPTSNIQNLFLCINRLIFMEINGEESNAVFLTGSYEIDYPAIRYPNLSDAHFNQFMINRAERSAKHPIKTTVFLIDKKKIYPDFLEYFDGLYFSPFFNPKAKYIVVDEDLSANLAQEMKSFSMINVIFLQPSSGEIRVVPPFKDKKFSSNISELEYAGKCNNMRPRVLQSSAEFFEREDREFWKGWNLNICYRDNCNNCGYNNEYKILDIIFDTLQMKRKYLPWNQYFNICEITFGRLLRTDQPNVEYTFPYLDDAMWWFIPRPELKLIEWFPFRIFSLLLWGLSISCLLIITIVWLLVKNTFGGSISLIDNLKIMKIFSILFLEQSTNWISRSTSETQLKLLCIFLAFMLNAIYKGKLLYVLLGKEWVNHNFTIEQFFHQIVPVGYSITDISPKAFTGFSLIPRKCNTSFECLKRAAFKKEFPVIAFGNDERDARPYLFDESGRYLLKKLTPAFSKSKSVAMVIPGHPFFHIFNKYIFYLLEHGFVEYITRSNVELSTELILENEVLGLEHIEAPALLWILGITLAIFAFVVEYFNLSLSKILGRKTK